MRILLVSQNYFVRGGSDAVFLGSERILTRRGHMVIPFAAADTRNLDTHWSAYFPRTINLDAPKLSDAPRMLFSRSARRSVELLLEDNPIDIAHLHIYYGRITSSILDSFHRRSIPIVQTLHEYRSVCPVSTMFRDGAPCGECKGFQYWRAVRHRCNRGSFLRSGLSALEMYVSDLLGAKQRIRLFLTVSEFQRQQLIQMGMPAKSMRTVHNAVSPDLFSERQGGQLHVLYLGRIEVYKGVYEALEVAARMPSTKFVFAGAGSELEMAKGMAKQSGLINVEFRGMLQGDSLAEAIEDAICVIAPSLCAETFGLAVVEAMAKGIPVVATRTGGFIETVDHGKTGFLVPVGDVDALSERIAELVDDPEKARELGNAGRQRARNHFSEEAHYARLMDSYDAIRNT